jgi:hypothetical protein
MNLQSVISQVADEADELLGSCSSMEEARVELQDHVQSAFPKLTAAEKTAAVRGVLSILKQEGFFETTRTGDRFGSEDSDDAGEE